jgi:hypothetical protein
MTGIIEELSGIGPLRRWYVPRRVETNSAARRLTLVKIFTPLQPLIFSPAQKAEPGEKSGLINASKPTAAKQGTSNEKNSNADREKLHG